MDEEPVLEGAAGSVGVAEVVDRGAVGGDPGAQRLDHPVAQSRELRTGQPPRRAQRVDAGSEERLVGVDVAHASDPPLVEQEGLDRRAAAARLRRAGSRS